MEKRIKITYRGKIDDVLEKDLENLFRINDYEYTGSGYDCETKERDLEFTKKSKDEILEQEIKNWLFRFKNHSDIYNAEYVIEKIRFLINLK